MSESLTGSSLWVTGSSWGIVTGSRSPQFVLREQWYRLLQNKGCFNIKCDETSLNKQLYIIDHVLRKKVFWINCGWLSILVWKTTSNDHNIIIKLPNYELWYINQASTKQRTSLDGQLYSIDPVLRKKVFWSNWGWLSALVWNTMIIVKFTYYVLW